MWLQDLFFTLVCMSCLFGFGCVSEDNKLQEKDESSTSQNYYLIQSVSITDGIQTLFILDANTGMEVFSLSSEQIDDSRSVIIDAGVFSDEEESLLMHYPELDASLSYNWTQAQMAPTGELVILVEDGTDLNPKASHFLIVDTSGTVQYKIFVPYAHHSFDIFTHDDGSWSLVYLKAEPRPVADFPELNADREWIVGDQVVWMDMSNLEIGSVDAQVKWSSFDTLVVQKDGGNFYGDNMIDWTHINSIMIDQQSNSLTLSIWALHSILILDINTPWTIHRAIYSTHVNEQMFIHHPQYSGYPYNSVDFMNPHGAKTSTNQDNVCFMDNSKAEAVCLSIEDSSNSITEQRTDYDHPVIAFGNVLAIPNQDAIIVNWGSSLVDIPCQIQRFDVNLRNSSWSHSIDLCSREHIRVFLGYSRLLPQQLSSFWDAFLVEEAVP